MLALPDGAERPPLLDDHAVDAPVGGVGHGDGASLVAHREHQVLVVGHPLVEVALGDDPEVLALGQVDGVPQIVEAATPVVDRGVARQLRMVLEAVDAVLESVLDAGHARAVAAEDRLHQLAGRVELVGAVPAAQRPPFLIGGDHRMEGEPDAGSGDGAPHVGHVGQRLSADEPADHDAGVADPVLDHVVVAERARAEDAVVVRVEVVHRVERLGVHVAARVAAARVDREPEARGRLADVLVEAAAVDGGGRVADRAVVVERGLDEVVAAGARDPVRRHLRADVGREARVLDVVGGRDQVLDLVVEEGVVPHAVHVVPEGEHAVVSSEGAQAGLPEIVEARLLQQAPQEEEQGVAPVGRVGPVADRLHVEVRLQHAAHQLQDLVGHVGGARGEHDRGAERRGGRGGGVGEIAGQLHQVREHAAARRGLDDLRGVARVAAHVERLPRRPRERRAREPAPSGVAGDRPRRGPGQPEDGRGQVGPAGDDQPPAAGREPALDARDRVGAEVGRVGDQQRAQAGQHLVAEIGFLDEIVLEVAAPQQHGGTRRAQVGVLALEPGARAIPRVGEAIGVAAGDRVGRVGVAAPPAPQRRDVVPPGTDHGSPV